MINGEKIGYIWSQNLLLTVILRILTASFLCCFALLSCSPTYKKYVSAYQVSGKSEQPNYSDLYYWAAHPLKQDPSDSIPEPLRKEHKKDSRVAVFFVHPTTLTNYETDIWNASLNDAELNAKTDYSSILLQASAFNEYDLFAPRYRQAHIKSYFTTDTITALKAFDTAYFDVKNAFLAFLSEIKGRPFIIASHSQGSTHAIRLLKEMIDGTDLRERLVAAYLVGMYIPAKNYQTISVCTNPSQIQCVCGWRTYKMGYLPDFVAKEEQPWWVTNPLYWTTDTTKIDRSKNPGSVLNKFNKIVRRVADAQISNGVLWTRKPSFPGSFLLRTNNYHIGDINLYYVSIQMNLRERVASYFASSKK